MIPIPLFPGVGVYTITIREAIIASKLHAPDNDAAEVITWWFPFNIADDRPGDILGVLIPDIICGRFETTSAIFLLSKKFESTIALDNFNPLRGY